MIVDKNTNIYVGDTKIGKICQGDNVIYNILPIPSEYQKVEWIASSGTQYIKSEIIPNVNTFYDMKIESTNYQFWVFGCDKEWEDTGFGFQGMSFRFASQQYYLGFYNNTYQEIHPLNHNILSFVSYVEPNKIIINDNQFDIITNTIQTDLELYLFGQNRNNTAVDMSVGKIYYLKFYDNSTLIADFVPCYRKSDNEIGLYDVIRKKFYTNSGTGIFIKGNDVR